MSGEHTIPTAAKGFLIVVGGGADITKIGLDALFGVGIILDPLVISPITGLVFWIVLNHNGIPMFSGKYSRASWINLTVGLTPGVDALPDWSAYAIYLALASRAQEAAPGESPQE